MKRDQRLYDLVQIMCDGRLHTAADLAARLGVSERTIWRDMAVMAASGIPVEGERGLGYILRSALVLPPTMLTAAELEATVSGLRRELRFGTEVQARAARSMLEKLATLLPQAGIDRVSSQPTGNT